MTPSPQPPPKKDVMLALLERSSVFIHLDPRKDDVRVPPWFKKQPQLVLQVGLNMAVRISDLDVGDDAVSCTLSFNRSPVFCYMPWTAVFALVGDDGKGMIWPNDIPKEVAAQQAEQVKRDQAKAQIRAVPASAAAPTPASLPASVARTQRDPAAPAAKPAKAEAGKRSPKKRAPARLRAEKPAGEERSAPEPAPRVPSSPGTAAQPGRAGGAIGAVRGAPAGGESKRPLPSYLRVVK